MALIPPSVTTPDPTLGAGAVNQSSGIGVYKFGSGIITSGSQLGNTLSEIQKHQLLYYIKWGRTHVSNTLVGINPNFMENINFALF